MQTAFEPRATHTTHSRMQTAATRPKLIWGRSAETTRAHSTRAREAATWAAALDEFVAAGVCAVPERLERRRDENELTGGRDSNQSSCATHLNAIPNTSTFRTQSTPQSTQMSILAPPPPPSLHSQLSSSAPTVDRARPPPSALVGHENLFAYWGLGRWAREHTKIAAAAATGGAAATSSGAGSLDALLHSKGLPLLAGDRLPDGSMPSLNPNDSLLALGFQAPGPPLPLHKGLSDAAKRGATFSAISRGAATAPLSLAAKFAALLAERQAAVEEAMRLSKREKKRARKERAGLVGIPEEDPSAAAASFNAAAANASAAAPAAVAAGGAATTGASENKFKISLKRKADDGSGGGGAAAGGAEMFFPSTSSAGLTPAQEADKKKKKSKKKGDDALVV